MSGRRTGLLLVLLNVALSVSAELTFDEDGHLLDDGLYKSYETPDQKKDDHGQAKVRNLDESFSLDNKDGEEKAAGERLAKEEKTDRKMKKRKEHHHHRHHSPVLEDKEVSFEPAGERVMQQPSNQAQAQPDALKALGSPEKKEAETSPAPEGAGQASVPGLVPTPTDPLNEPAKPTELGAQAKGLETQPDQAVRNELDLYPWESADCKDIDAAACEAFKPMCPIMGIIAYRKCRKTCKVCATDEHEPHVLGAKIVSIGASVILSQKGPTAPTFLTVCVKKDEATKMGLDKGTHGLVIHSYGEVGQNCQNFGPHYNPFGTGHGHPDDVMKHAGDLGQLSFGGIPEDWPDDVPKCSSDLLLGAYGMYDHVQLYGDVCPSGRPVVLYKGEAPMLEFEKSAVIGCGRLDTLRGETAWGSGGSNQGEVKAEDKPKTAVGQSASESDGETTNSVVLTGSRVKAEAKKEKEESKEAHMEKKKEEQAEKKEEKKEEADKATDKSEN